MIIIKGGKLYLRQQWYTSSFPFSLSRVIFIFKCVWVWKCSRACKLSSSSSLLLLLLLFIINMRVNMKRKSRGFGVLFVGLGVGCGNGWGLQGNASFAHILQISDYTSLFIQGMFLLSNIAAGDESHKEAVMSYLVPLQADGSTAPFIVKFLRSKHNLLRTTAIWCVVNLTNPDSAGSSTRVARLQDAGIISQIKTMVNDPFLDCKVLNYSSILFFPNELSHFLFVTFIFSSCSFGSGWFLGNVHLLRAARSELQFYFAVVQYSTKSVHLFCTALHHIEMNFFVSPTTPFKAISIFMSETYD